MRLLITTLAEYQTVFWLPVGLRLRERYLHDGRATTLRDAVLAAVEGAAAGAGFSLALACDFRIASTTAKLGSATLRMGYLPDEGGHHLLVHTIGVAKTLDFLINSRIVEQILGRCWHGIEFHGRKTHIDDLLIVGLRSQISFSDPSRRRTSQ